MKKLTKAQQILVNNYLLHLMHNPIRSIYEAYKSPSWAKERAWEYCEQLCKEKNGKNLIVCNFNTMVFSAGFEFVENGIRHIAYITRDYDRFIPVEEVA